MDEAIATMKNGNKIPIFPKLLKCPNCAKKLRAPKAGRFHCPECTRVLSIDESGNLILGLVGARRQINEVGSAAYPGSSVMVRRAQKAASS
jgi:hypothetical protein